MIRVIVADDDELVLESICESMDCLGVSVVGRCKDGLDAFNLYKKHRPDFILIDHNMSKHDGIYALKHIKELDSNSKVVLMSVDHLRTFEKDACSYNVDMIVIKPFNIKVMVDKMKSKIFENSTDS